MRKNYLQITALVILGLIIWGKCVNFDLSYDDNAHIEHNPIFLNKLGIAEIFKSPTWPGNLYRPLTISSFYITYTLLDSYVFWLHLTNILLHLLVSILVFLTIKLFLDNTISFLISLLFLVHPLSVEVVANISNRNEELAATSILLIILLANKFEKLNISRLFLFSLIFFLGLLSKESCICGLILIPFVYYIKTGNRGNTLKLGLSLLSISVLYLVIRTNIVEIPKKSLTDVEFIDNIMFDQSFFNRLPYALSFFGDYIRMVLMPNNIMADYSFPQYTLCQGFCSAEFYLSALLPLILTGLVLISYKSDKKAFVFGLWFLIMSTLTTNFLIVIGTHFGTRLMYFPSIGLLGFLFCYLSRLNKKFITFSIFAILFVSFSASSFLDQDKWKNDFELKFDDISRGCKSVKVLNYFAFNLLSKGKTEEALSYAKQSYSSSPDIEPTLNIMQKIYLTKRDLNNAEIILSKLLVANPGSEVGIDGMGWLRLYQNNFAESEKFFINALNINGSFNSSKIGLFAIAVATNNQPRMEEILKVLPEICKKDPRFIEAENKFSVLRKN